MSFVDFDDYVNKEWKEKNVIPDDQHSWNSFTSLREETFDKLCDLLKSLPDDNQVGILYNSGMNNFSDSFFLQEKIDEIKTSEDLIKTIVYFHKLGINLVFNINSSTDDKDSKYNRLSLYQGGLSLPDRDYYFDDKFLDKYNLFKEHLTDIIGSGYDKVLEIENKIAKLHRTKTELLNSDEQYYKYSISSFIKDSEDSEELQINKMWQLYFEELNFTKVECLLLNNPKFFREILKILIEDLDNTKIYLKYRILKYISSFSSEELELKFFNFYDKILSGQQSQKIRSKRILEIINKLLGQLFGKYYSERYFNEENKTEVINMINNIENEVCMSIKNNNWMSDTTKEKALKKLSTFRKKIGYPDVWPDYSNLKLSLSNSFLENILEVNKFNFNKDIISTIDKEVDKNKWYMNAYEINAYYDQNQNEIVFPAGILQYPFFDKNSSKATNYGGIGAVIAHEITHGFDNYGRKYDHEGNLKDWWSKEDSDKYDEQTQLLIEQYNSYKIHDHNVNGELTLSENIADYGGLILSYRALINNNSNENPKEFFESWARIWRCIMKKDRAIQLLSIDCHAPMKYRVACVRNIPDFFELYNITEDNPLYVPPEKRIKLW